jgi:SynChlorMet cassette radical SAM/SPASM protein ScmF
MNTKTTELGFIYINPAGGCNLQCRHCWVNEGASTEKLLTLEQWKSLLYQAKELGCDFVKLTGGEPLLYPDIVPLYRFASESFTKVVIETNGTLQPEGLWNAFLDKKPFHLSISIDSADPAVHDDFRGQKESWRKTVEFAEKLVEYGINSQVIMSISDTRRKPIQDMVNLVERMGGLTLKINFITPSGRGENNNFFDNTSIQEALNFFNWINTETPEWVQPSIPAALLPVDRLVNLGYCHVRNLMGVLPDGTFSLCGVAFSRKEMAWGKFPDVSVKTAWENSPVYKLIRSSIPDSIEGICSRCIHRNSCQGRCAADNMETGGTITSPDALCQRAYDAGLFPLTRLKTK